MIGRYIWGLVLVAIGISIFFPEFLTSTIVKVIIAAALVLAGLRIIFGGRENK